MNKNEFADYLSLKVQLYLAPTGFSYVKSKHAFLKKNKDVKPYRFCSLRCYCLTLTSIRLHCP